MEYYRAKKLSKVYITISMTPFSIKLRKKKDRKNITFLFLLSAKQARKKHVLKDDSISNKTVKKYWK